ncbi:MAG: alkane 1-monooxygenase, partial [Bacteroidota bacterium]
YMHFNIEHNRGHHKWVSTPHDPASSRYGESVYRFWLRTVSGSFISACRIERDDAKRHGYAVWSLKNKMVLFIIIQLGYLLFVGVVFGWAIVPLAIGMAVAGFTLLEVVNYIEHYGLTRQKLASGRYEPVQPHHSWNSDHYFGRILLYELTRHSDHHYKSSRKYQVLRHLDESPQMPLGYPASMLMSLLPPLWFSVMHRHPALQTAS